MEVEAFNMGLKHLLAKYDDCYALLTTKDIQAGDFMADMKGIYEAPEIDGKIFFTSEKKLTIGDFVKVSIDSTMDYDLIGAVTDEFTK